MAEIENIPPYPGSSSFFPGTTPFGFYDYDLQFQADADKVTTYCARRLGYPMVDVELQDLNFYAAFEEAITTYGNEVYAFKIKQDYLSLEGLSTGSNLNNTLITPSYAGMIRLSKQYGVEAGVGGNVDWKWGSIAVTASTQIYDLNIWAAANSVTGGIEIKRIFYEKDPAIMRTFDPANLLNAVNLSNVSTNMTNLMMPLSYDFQRLNSIELNDLRLSQYSFELINNKLRIFPVPKENDPRTNIYFQYIELKDRNITGGVTGSNLITNVSNVPFGNPVYSQINPVGRMWIFEYTLAICKETLGYIRGKYQTIPIPNSETTLNHNDLITSATNDKAKLREKLAAYLEETSRNKLLERTAQEAEYKIKENNSVPLQIYLG